MKYTPGRKRKSSATAHEAFSRMGSLFDVHSQEELQDLVTETHPSIADFVVRARKTSAERQDTDTLEMDSSALRPRPRSLLFISFGSGSSGNCAYIGTSTDGLLIDAGVDADTVKQTLRSHGISPRAIRGIIVTHDHSDHVKYAYTMVRKHPERAIYCTPKTLSGLLRRHNISRRIKDYHRPIYKEFPFNVGDFTVTAFDVSHDGTDNSGYFIEWQGINVCVATDLGCITERVEHYMCRAAHIVIESNYDAQMLAAGPYPLYLQARIAAARGHMDNAVTARFLARIASTGLRSVFLCHLSQDNNTPALATETVRSALETAGTATFTPDETGASTLTSTALMLLPLPRTEPSPLFTLY